jgi:hypothetical protein
MPILRRRKRVERADSIPEPDMIRSEGAEMLHRRGYWVHRRPDGAYLISPNRIEFFRSFASFPMSAGFVNWGWTT